MRNETVKLIRQSFYRSDRFINAAVGTAVFSAAAVLFIHAVSGLRSYGRGISAVSCVLAISVILLTGILRIRRALQAHERKTLSSVGEELLIYRIMLADENEIKEIIGAAPEYKEAEERIVLIRKLGTITPDDVFSAFSSKSSKDMFTGKHELFVLGRLGDETERMLESSFPQIKLTDIKSIDAVRQRFKPSDEEIEELITKRHGRTVNAKKHKACLKTEPMLRRCLICALLLFATSFFLRYRYYLRLLSFIIITTAVRFTLRRKVRQEKTSL